MQAFFLQRFIKGLLTIIISELIPFTYAGIYAYDTASTIEEMDFFAYTVSGEQSQCHNIRAESILWDTGKKGLAYCPK